MRLLLPLVIVFLLVSNLLAQEKVIKGSVIDYSTGDPVANIIVQVKGTTLTTTADEKGHFTVHIPDSIVEVEFSVKGYRLRKQQKLGNYYKLFVESDIFSLSLPDLMNLQVYSTSKKDENLICSPAAIELFPLKNIEILNYSKLIDIMEFATGMSSVNGEGNFFYTTTIRGNTRVNYNTNTLLLYNGIKIYNPYHGSFDFQVIPISSINNIEIVKGANSVLYGTNAMNAMINVVSRDEIINEPHFNGYGVRTQLGDYNSLATNFYLISKEGNTKFTFYSDLYSTRGEPLTYYDEQGHELTYNRGYLGYNVATSLSYGKVKFDILSYRRSELVVRTRGFSLVYTSNQDTIGTPVPELNDEQMYIGNVSFNTSVMGKFKLKAQSEILKWYNVKYLVDGQWLYSSIGNFNTLELSPLDSGKFLHLLGFSLDNYIGRRFKTQENDYDIGKDNLFTHELATYYNGSFYLLDWLSVYYGARLLFSFYKRSFWNLSPRFATVIKIDKFSALKFVYGQSFRVPTYFEKEVHSDKVIGNPYLEPEKSISYDLVYYRAQPKIQFSIDLFYTQIINQIERVVSPVNPDMQINLNMGTNIYKGIEISGVANFYKIYGFAGYSYTLGNNEQTSQALEFTYRHMFSSGLLFEPVEWLKFKASYKYLSHWGPAPAYHLVNLATSFKFLPLPLEIEFRFNNLLNKEIFLPEIARDNITIPKTYHRMFYITIMYRFF